MATPFNPHKWQGFTKKLIDGKLYEWDVDRQRYIITRRDDKYGKTQKSLSQSRSTTPPSTADRTRKIDTTRIDEYQGQTTFAYGARGRLYFRWSKQDSRYVLHSRNTIGDNPTTVQGVRFTFFSASAVYVKKGHERNVATDRFHSNVIFGRKIFTSSDSKKRQGIVPSNYGGAIPLEVLMDKLNESIGTDDFRLHYRNWSFRYEVGSAVYVYDKSGKQKLRKVIDKGSIQTGTSGFF